MSTADLSGAVSGADSPPQEPVTSPDHTEPGSRRRPDRIGAYVLLYRLGHGGMSEVHLAEHMETGERVAIKHVPAGGDPNHLRRLRREARTTARLEHPGIVRVREAIDGDEGLWLVMDHVAGTTLYDVTHDGPMEPVRALRIALQIAEALIAAHDLGILHRDLKSENVMLTPPGDRVRLLDFGLAKMLWTDEESQSLTVHGEVMGTCRAMSPEQARGQELDPRSDLFALGSLLYEMVTGSSAFQAGSPVATMTRVCDHHPTPAHLVESRVPRAVSALIARLMAKKRDDRPADARQAAAAIRRTLGGLEAAPKVPWTALLAATAGVLLVAWAASSLRSRESQDAGGGAPGAAAAAGSVQDSGGAEARPLGEIEPLLSQAQRLRALPGAGDDELREARRLAYDGLSALDPPWIPGGQDRQQRLELAIEACALLAEVDRREGFPEAAEQWTRLAREWIEEVESVDARSRLEHLLEAAAAENPVGEKP